MKKTILLFGGNSLVAKELLDLNDANLNIYCFNKGDSLASLDSSLKYDLAIYLAQSPEYKGKFYSEDLHFVNNVLLRSALEWSVGKVRAFVNFSSASVYEATTEGKYFNNSNLNWNSKEPYVISKLSGEMIFNSFRKYFQYHLNLRPFFIYGKYQKPNFIIQKLLTKVINFESIELPKGVGLVFNPLPSNDCAKWLIKLLDDDFFQKLPDNLNISGQEEMNLGQILDFALLELGRERNLIQTTVLDYNVFLNSSIDTCFMDVNTPWKQVIRSMIGNRNNL